MSAIKTLISFAGFDKNGITFHLAVVKTILSRVMDLVD